MNSTMEKILNWIKLHKVRTIFILAAIILLPIIVLHLLFKIRTDYYWIQADWQSGDVLGYFGDVLSFVGTIILGYVAIIQAEKANQLSNELLKIEKNRIKPCLDVSAQLYKIYLAEDANNKLVEINNNNSDMIMEFLYTENPRTGITTTCAVIELEIANNGHSDIQRMFVNDNCFYLSAVEPFNSQNEKIVFFVGDTSLKVNEKKILYIHIRREIHANSNLNSDWYRENTDKIMPHIEFELELETFEGDSYIEKISCGSSWNNAMETVHDTITRYVGIEKIEVKENIIE